jgi:hypothetical protein
VNDLEALTFGAQFRGIGNVKVGQNAIDSFFNLMNVLLAAYNPQGKGRRIAFLNDSKLPVTVRIAPDPMSVSHSDWRPKNVNWRPSK